MAAGVNPHPAERQQAMADQPENHREEMITVKVDLNAAGNMFGPLNGELRVRLMSALRNPTQETWNDAYSVILRERPGMGLTLWKAVLAVDPGFASAKAPVTRWVEDDSELGGHSEPVSGWSRVPSSEVIMQAISYATR